MVALESIPLFRNLAAGELQALRVITKELQFASQSEIFREGDPGNGVYFVKDGLVEISGVITENRRRTFSQLGPGEIFGEMAVIEHRPRSATAIALKDTTVYFIPRGEMLSFIERSPALALALLQQISHRLRDFNQLHLREVLQAERLAVVGNFSRSIIHDLKNPLSIIALSAELFDLPNVRPEVRAQTHTRIKKQVERIGDLISDIMIFTEGKQMMAAPEPLDFHAFVLDLLADLRTEAETKGINIELQNTPTNRPVPFDPRRLNRVFHNLIHNAMDAMPDGGTIFLRFSSDDKELLTEIEDTGPGIAPEIADRLFETFATFGKQHGTGLGLSICKKIIEDHGGRISARTEPGHGAIFSFSLPFRK